MQRTTGSLHVESGWAGVVAKAVAVAGGRWLGRERLSATQVVLGLGVSVQVQAGGAWPGRERPSASGLVKVRSGCLCGVADSTGTLHAERFGPAPASFCCCSGQPLSLHVSLKFIFKKDGVCD